LGFQLDGEKPSTPCRTKTFFWGRCRGLEEEQAPTSTTFSHVNYAPADIFLAPLPGKKKTSARGVSHAHPLLCFKFCFTLFLLTSFYQKHTKN
jgi:hypothetical protein